jgi:hypothetical protein
MVVVEVAAVNAASKAAVETVLVTTAAGPATWAVTVPNPGRKVEAAVVETDHATIADSPDTWAMIARNPRKPEEVEVVEVTALATTADRPDTWVMTGTFRFVATWCCLEFNSWFVVAASFTLPGWFINIYLSYVQSHVSLSITHFLLTVLNPRSKVEVDAEAAVEVEEAAEEEEVVVEVEEAAAIKLLCTMTYID